MQWYGSTGGRGGLWVGPALLGVLLILIGILLYAMPALLAYVVAGVFVLVGCGLLGTAWRMRRQVTYHGVDRQWHVEDDGPGGP